MDDNESEILKNKKDVNGKMMYIKGKMNKAVLDKI